MTHEGMPQRSSRALGQQGEQLAAEHLAARGVEILTRNWRCSIGEIDIVGRDHDAVVFYEVKTRRSARFGSPVEAITPAKAARLRRLASRWLAEHQVHAGEVRVDVLALTASGRGATHIEHLRGVC
ncbi:MAG: YraN family protein [Ornithinimicrobium sp.]